MLSLYQTIVDFLANCITQTHSQGLKNEAWGSKKAPRNDGENITLVKVMTKIDELNRGLEVLKEEFASFKHKTF